MLISHNREKLINAIIFFYEKTALCNKLKLYKLLYHLDFRHFAETGRSVTGLDYFALPNGPVPVELTQEIDSPGKDLEEKIDFSYVTQKMGDKKVSVLHITPKAKFDPSAFTKRELRLLESIAYDFDLSKAEDMIHSTHLPGDPWERVFVQEGRRNQEIPYEYAVTGNDAEDVLEAAQEHREILLHYA